MMVLMSMVGDGGPPAAVAVEAGRGGMRALGGCRWWVWDSWCRLLIL